MRFFFFAWLAGAVLAGVGFSRLSLLKRKKLSLMVQTFVFVALLVEYHPASWLAARSVAVPPPLAISDSYTLLATEEERGAVVDLPLTDSLGNRGIVNTRYIYGSSGHLRRVLAISGSFDPPVVDTLRAASAALPDDRASDILARHGVSRIVVHKQLMPADIAEKIIKAFREKGYRELFTGNESVVFELRR